MTSKLYIVTLLFNLHAEYLMRIKTAGRNINNLRYSDDTTLMTESKELKSLLMKAKEENEKVGLKLIFRKLRSWHLVPSLHGKTVETVTDFIFGGLQNHCRW